MNPGEKDLAELSSYQVLSLSFFSFFFTLRVFKIWPMKSPTLNPKLPSPKAKKKRTNTVRRPQHR